MDRLKLLMVFLTFASAWDALAAVLCWTNPNCYCTGRKTKTIYCRGVENVSDIEGLFEKWTFTDRLRIYGNFTTLPSKAFNEFKVYFLALLSPLEENIPEDALLGVKYLQTVNLTSTRYRKLPKALVPENLKKFQSNRGLLSGIETELQNMTDLEHVQLDHNEISFVSADAFQGTHNVQVLDLSYNKLTYLDPDTFVSLKFLSRINLKLNQLQTVDGCFQTLNPRVINLYGNNISSVEHAFHRGMWSMKILNLGGNPHLDLSASAFNRSMKSLSQLYLSDVDFHSVDPHLLIYFPNLLNLYMNRDNITFIPKNFFGYNPSLHTLQLSDNRLKSIDGLFVREDLTIAQWKDVRLDGNELTSVSFCESFQGVHTLDISRNRIESIKREDLESMKALRYFNLSWNGIRELESESFADIHFLRDLDLSGSRMRNLNGSLKNMQRLFYFTMRHSALETLTEEDFSGSELVKLIDVRNNSLSSVYGCFRSMKYISVVDLSMNNLTTLTADSFPPFGRSSIRITRIWMADNPWSCDCRLSWITNWLAKDGTSMKDNPICSTPAHLQGRNISSLSKEDFEVWVDDCPDKCKCLCRAQEEDVGTEVNCSRKGLEKIPEVLPSNAWSVNLQGNALNSFDGRSVLYIEKLFYLNLEDNKISEIRLDLPNGTSSVLLAGNGIRVLSQGHLDILGSLSNVTLSRNPWTCNCATWSFRTWLIQHNDSVLDLQEVRCGPDESFFLRHKPIIHLTRKDLCAVLHDSTIIIIAVCASGFLILCLLCSWWWGSISALFYSYGCTFLKNGEKHDDPYDVFLMYSEEDEDLALGELAKGLEDEPTPFYVCIPSRDIAAPRTPERTSAYLMQCSKVIVLLTRKFIENYECMHLLKTALSYSLESSARYIIFVTHGDVPRRSQLDPLLAATMKSSKCLRWGERLFWKKLVYSLPKRTRKTVYEGGTEDQGPLLTRTIQD